MKVSVSNNKATTLTFPVLMRAIGDELPHSSFIVLFTDKNIGMVVQGDTKSPYSLGYYSRGWMPCTSEKDWEELVGSVTLEND